jgi:hypothetical protein
VNLSDPSGEIVGGLCLNANIGIAAFGTCSLCIVGTSNKEIGLVANVGGGGTTEKLKLWPKTTFPPFCQ